MSTKQNIISDINNQMEIKSFNIQEKFNNQWESNPNQEKINVKKFRKERNKSKKK